MSVNQQPPSSESTSRSLLRRAQEFDAAAWEKLAALYTPSVYQWCRRAGLQSSDAADVSQEVFQAVAKSIGGFRKEQPQDTFRGWLWTITRNKIRDHFRAAAKQPDAPGGSSAQQQLEQLADELPDESSESHHLQSQLARRAMALMQSDFEESTWQAFWQTAVEQQPAQAVAAELNISPAAVYMAKSRVLRRLREELEGLDLLDG